MAPSGTLSSILLAMMTHVVAAFPGEITASLDVTSRNDAMAVQYLIPGWEFDPRRPALVRWALSGC
ncbi:MAG: hypothetical protein ACLFRS_06720 [Halomonas sp.]